MRALLDRPATLPIAGALLGVLHLGLSADGLIAPEHLSGGLLIALGLGLAAFLPALAPSLVAVGAVTGGGIPLLGVPVDGVLVGLLVLWSTARRLGPWTRTLTLVGALLLAGVAGLVAALSGTEQLLPQEASADQVLLFRAVAALVVAALLAGLEVLVWRAGVRRPVGPDDRIDALLVRVAGPQDGFAVGAAGWQALLLLLISTVPFAAPDGSLQPVVGGVLAVALVLHRRAPALSLTIAWGGALLQMGLQLAPGPADLAILAVLFGTGASERRRVRAAGAVSAVLGAVVAVVYLIIVFRLVQSIPSPILTGGAVFGGILATLGLSWTVGLLSRSVRRAREGQALRAEAERERAAAQRELDTVEERNRIARDMHDVVAHSLAVVIAQADGARYLGASSPEQTDAALLTISSVARDALGDVRVLLAQLRHSQSDGPQPEARDLPALLESVSGAGTQLRSELEVDLETVPRGIGLALYRIVQEATTNALRHGRPGSPLDVALRRESGEIVLTVRNARCADAEAAARVPGEGHGLVGMRERAALVGGVLRAGPDGDDFVVDARLPAPSSTALPVASGGHPA
ncbi:MULTISPECIES: histidine kinase [unclassified Rathayibacter]|uniref:sensor histidine kinase n=1 Tax=unclassified Rathayibacter TaxID=2609250 RepID=UPI0010442DE2|nr:MULTISPECIES: histidine kinase [unclassified Rathayibacter]TCL78271.1 signal transduction histidine kinase [Rathayibacter sp. PhB192]TCM23874.1 signal transduction histidine kinase [Rathayibacter sp. PhB179]